MLASRLVAGHRQRLTTYSEARVRVTGKNVDHFDQLAQTAQPRGFFAIQKATIEENNRQQLAMNEQNGVALFKEQPTEADLEIREELAESAEQNRVREAGA